LQSGNYVEDLSKRLHIAILVHFPQSQVDERYLQSLVEQDIFHLERSMPLSIERLEQLHRYVSHLERVEVFVAFAFLVYELQQRTHNEPTDHSHTTVHGEETNHRSNMNLVAEP
jgi:hypothetical protein